MTAPAAAGPLPVVALSTGDTGEVMTLQRAAYVSEGQLHDDLGLPPLTQPFDELRAELGRADVFAWGIRSGGRLVAAVRVLVRGHHADLGRLTVAPDRQGEGFGTRLLRHAEEHLPDAVTTIELFTGERSTANLRLYQRQGYRETHRSPAGHYDLVHLRKQLRMRPPAAPEAMPPGGLHDPGDVLDRARELARHWLGSLSDRPVGIPVDAQRMRDRVDDTLPAQGASATTVLDELAAALEPGLVASAGPRYFGFVTGGALPAALGADWLVSALEQNAASYVMSPAAAVIEDVVSQWVLDLLGLPPCAAVGFVTGAQMANVACLAAARHALLAEAGWDVETDGLVGAAGPTVVLGEQAHATLIQALRLLGLGSGAAIRIPTDDQGRIRPEDLRAQLAAIDGPVLVCAQAGQVNTGACDPLEAIAEVVAARSSAWLHVDGAFGLWAAASPSRRHLVAGAEHADSWAVDAHKWLNVPYDCAMAIVGDRAALTSALTTPAAYLPLEEGRDPSSRTPESSRRARAIPVYAALRTLGRQGVADLVERFCTLARQAADELARHPGVEILNEIELNQVLFRPRDLDPGELARAIAQDGTCWVGTTTWGGQPAIRFSVSNWSTNPDDISRSTARITALIERMPRPDLRQLR